MSSSTPRKSGPAPARHASAGATPTANKFRSSLVPMSRPSPGRALQPSSKLSAASGAERNLFSTATPKPSRITHFAPSLPAAATMASPGVRKFAPQKSTSAGMANTTSTELFKMRIPEPDDELSGEALAKAIPEALTRKGTVYADQYLADKCPAEFDDVQRRQFFCILDLRRLKFAANEIFVKKDWKLNMMNFAKEYEKSRGLIMLRYGLYEFKNVKPSADLMKRWRTANGLPDPEPEHETAETTNGAGAGTSATTGPTKRKAEDTLQQPKDNALMASTANQNKRRNVEQEQEQDSSEGVAKFAPSPMKSKRKADETEEPDENQRSKLQKAAPSAAKTKLESIINNVQSGSSTPVGTPLKRPVFGAGGSVSAQPLFGVAKKSGETGSSAFDSKPNPFSNPSNGVTSSSSKLQSTQFQPGKPLNGAIGGSVLSGHTFGSVPAARNANIFGYLSESSAHSSGNEIGDGDEDAESEPESEHDSDPESGSQDAPPSYEPSAAASTGTNTPPIQGASSIFSFNKTASTSNPFASAFKPADNSAKGGLFGRVSVGPDGQPLRATPTAEAPAKVPPPTTESVPETQQTKTPAKAPGDYTFNPATTPINFSQGATSTGSSIFAPKSTPAPVSDEIASTTNSKELEKAEKPQSSSAQSIFGAKPAGTQPMFGGFNKAAEDFKTDASQKPAAIFGTLKPTSAPTPKPADNESSKAGEPESSTAKEQPKSIFGSQPAFGATGPANGSLAAPASSIFGGFKKTTEPEKTGAGGSSSIFGTKTTAPSSIFAAPSPAPPNASDSEPSAKRGFGDSEEQRAKRPMFASQSRANADGQAAKRPMFALSKPEEADTGSLAKTQSTPSTGTLFGSTAPIPGAAAPSSMFGNTSSAASPAFQFGSAAKPDQKPEEHPAAKPSMTFGASTPAPSSAFTFGAQSNTPAAKENQAPPSSTFNFGANQNNTTAQESRPAPSSTFSFGANQNTSTPLFGGLGTQANGAGSGSTPFAFGGGQDTSSNQGSFTFTAGVNNPFAGSNPPATASFGPASATPTPSGSFNFQFGGQGPSTPKPAPTEQKALFGGQSNGASAAPGFSFTSATPPQNTSNTFAPKPSSVFSSLLNPGGSISNGASSPFPAPSSMNTTPVNGTPEPQTPAEDGEEGPQEQLSLTEGGPGEEDEQILHEVRTKAIKYVPVGQGSDDEDAQKSPWRTQGVGPLRVLKNKSTGTVRILLRAEPRGHIAMNKTILSEFEYKADGKTVKLMAASDDGSKLETWMLQVKKPESAAALASVLQANKGANKK